MGISMSKNGQSIMYSRGNNAGGYETLSNGLSLELEEGDVVYMRLPLGNRLVESREKTSSVASCSSLCEKIMDAVMV